jgi:hypothetical protein
MPHDRHIICFPSCHFTKKWSTAAGAVCMQIPRAVVSRLERTACRRNDEKSEEWEDMIGPNVT